jgi:hypothetical protein
MEQEIHFTDNKFDFSQISVSQPVSVQGGAYFTKIKCDTKPLYIQLPKCYTKQGLNETNKKSYIDLMFTNDDYEVVEWFENLEETLVNLIYEKRDIWFQNEMDKEDIEHFFNPTCRSFKGGKFHLIRFNVPKNKTINSQYHCNVYDENENMVPIRDLNETHAIIPCLEVQGIKFSARNFQLDLVGKQIMLLNNQPLFNSCIIKHASNTAILGDKPDIVNDNNTQSQLTDNDIVVEPVIEEPHIEPIIKSLNESTEESDNECETNITNISNDTEITHTLDNTLDDTIGDTVSIKGLQTNIINTLAESDDEEDKNMDMVDNNSNNISNIEFDKSKSLEEVEVEEVEEVEKADCLEDITNNLSISNDKPNINLKKPNEVYYEIYKIAKEKAKQHKKASMTHYLEANKIKNTYMLDSLDDSDQSTEFESDMDTDIDSIKNEIDEFIEELN